MKYLTLDNPLPRSPETSQHQTIPQLNENFQLTLGTALVRGNPLQIVVTGAIGGTLAISHQSLKTRLIVLIFLMSSIAAQAPMNGTGKYTIEMDTVYEMEIHLGIMAAREKIIEN